MLYVLMFAKKNVIILLLINLLTVPLFAQQKKDSVEYWQQRVDTRIEVTLDDENHFLHGAIEMDYYNNSKDTLQYIYFHLYPNAYKNDRTAFARQQVENGNTKHYFSKEEDRGYVDSLYFEVNNQKAVLSLTSNIDVVKLMLPQPLLPGQQVLINTPFLVKIPLVFSRLGREGQSYQISQWFPKPAVYDHNGWNPYPYLDQGEFYSEWGSYEVKITLPKNYIVMATGNLQEENEKDWLDSLAQLPLTFNTAESNQIVSSQQWKTITFKEENVHDFAWFANKEWVVRKDEINIYDKSITAYSCYSPSHFEGWGSSMESIRKAIEEYSHYIGPYPYETVKVVEGVLSAGGGMEYPTVTVIAATNVQKFVDLVIIHEIGHNWFYGILANDERKHPWLDEGLNSFYERKIVKNNDAGMKMLGIDDEAKWMVDVYSAVRKLQPIDFASDKFRPLNYGVDVYYRAALWLEWLEAYMGKDNFSKAIKAYYQQWQFKHPQPEDFQKILKKYSPTDVDWFFEDAIQSALPVDFSIRKISKNKEGLLVSIKNKTRLKSPALVNVKTLSGDTLQLWTAPFTKDTILHFHKLFNYDKVWIDKVIPDFVVSNNINKRYHSLRPFFSLKNDFTYRHFVAPSFGFNAYNGWMTGLLWHNLSLPQRNFRYIAAPMYAWNSRSFAGTATLIYTHYPTAESFLRRIESRLEFKNFAFRTSSLNIQNTLPANYFKIAPELLLTFKEKNARSTVNRAFSAKGYYISEDKIKFEQSLADSLLRPKKDGMTSSFYGKFRYMYHNERTFNPFSYAFEAQIAQKFIKISATADMKIDYHLKNKALYFRFFGGKMFGLGHGVNTARYAFALAHSGINDYLYDDTYLSRNQRVGNFSQQVNIHGGGFKMSTLQYANPIGLSNDWMLALNVSTDIPYWNWNFPDLRLYADIGTYAHASQLNPSGASILYQAGLELRMSKYYSLYIPVLMSQDYKDYAMSVLGKHRFWKSITFAIHLSQIDWLNPTKLIEGIGE